MSKVDPTYSQKPTILQKLQNLTFEVAAIIILLAAFWLGFYYTVEWGLSNLEPTVQTAPKESNYGYK